MHIHLSITALTGILILVLNVQSRSSTIDRDDEQFNWHDIKYKGCKLGLINNCYDYIIVGSGTAGSILARKLSDDPRNRVLLLEKGYWSSLNPNIQEASKWRSLLTDPLTELGYVSVPQRKLQNRTIPQLRAKVTGGCNNHNAMAFIIGNRKDFDERWGPIDGWAWKDLSFYWNYINNTYTYTQLDATDPMMAQLLKTAEEIGYKYNPNPNDLNSVQGQGGVAPRIYTSKKVSDNYAQRISSWNAYVEPIIPRQNLDILVFTHVNKILFDKNLRAIGIEAFNLGSKEYSYFYSRKEIILSGGVFDTPKLLLLSGIGPCSELKQLKIPCLSHVPGVGKSLQDHTFLSLWSAPLLNQNMQMPSNVLGGWAAVAIEENGEYYHVLTINERNGMKAVQIFVETFHYQSRGSVTLQDDNPLSKPIIDPNYLSHLFDEEKTLAAVKVGRSFLSTEAIRSITDDINKEMAPGNNIKEDKDLLQWIRENASTDFHPAGTCKMGNDFTSDEMVVVDKRLRVRNTKGLRIADASVMPVLISGNPNQITMIIGFKAADMIKEDNKWF